MPERALGFEINEVQSADTGEEERHVVIRYGAAAPREVRREAERVGRPPDEVPDGGCRILFPDEAEVLVPDHIDIEKSLELRYGTVLLPFGGKMAAAVERIGIGPVPDGFFAIKEDEDDVINAGTALQGGGKFEKEACGGAAVIGAHEASHFLSVVMAGYGDGFARFPGEAADQVLEGDRAIGGGGGESVGRKRAAGRSKGLLNPGALAGHGRGTGVARAEGDGLPGEGQRTGPGKSFAGGKAGGGQAEGTDQHGQSQKAWCRHQLISLPASKG